MEARSLQPSAVAIAMPSTSPMAHPVRQCSVADTAVLQDASDLCMACSMSVNIYPHRVWVRRYRRRVPIADRQRAFEDAFLSPSAVRSYPARRMTDEEDSP